jgi:hypothetical protein
MRIGLVLFGHLRSFRKTHDSYKQFLKTLQQVGDVDVFCHTWDIEESVTASWWKENKPGDIPPATVNEDEIKEKYQPVRYSIEPSRQFDDSGYNIKTAIPVAGILSMLHSQHQAFQLLEQYSAASNVRYDVVIKSRYDLLYEIAPCFLQLIDTCLEDNCLYLPTSNPYELGGSFSDVFVMGPAKLVREYFNFIPDFKKAINTYQQKGYKEFLPELCLTEYLKWKNINIRELIGLRIHILRLNGDKFQINTDKNFSGNNPLCFFGETIKTNLRFLPEKNNVIANNTSRVVKKYMSWLNRQASENTLQQYADFYSGIWIGVSAIKGLASKGKSNSVFENNVMKNFFEEAMRNAKYGNAKKILVASILQAWSGYGFFFFKVLKKISFAPKGWLLIPLFYSLFSTGPILPGKFFNV